MSFSTITESLCKILCKNQFQLLFAALICISTIALAAAYYVEYIMGLEPCSLCIYQRIPYFMMIKLSVVALIIKKVSNYSVFLVIVILIAACGVAGYHTGLERELFEPTSLCSSVITIPEHLSISEIKSMLYNKEVVACSKPALKILHLSMTEWNLLCNLAILGTVIFLYRYQRLSMRGNKA